VIRILVADDQPLFCAGVARILDAEPDLHCVGAAHDGIDAVAAAERLRPDIVLMDLRMPILSGIEATRRIGRLSPPPRVLVLTTFRDRTIVRDAIDAGALGFVTKDATPERLCRAVRAVAGGSEVFADLHKPMLSDVVRAPDPTAIEALTVREKQIYLLLARGLTNTDIARRVHLSENTIRTHVSAILRKLALSGRVHVVDHAHRHGLVPDPATTSID
jgi:DNA-binding NarL/FixJ family response regulator